MLLESPRAVEVIEINGAIRCVENDLVNPVRKFDKQAGDFGTVELGGAPSRLGKLKSAASRSDRQRIAHLGLDAHDVRHVGNLLGMGQVGVVTD